MKRVWQILGSVVSVYTCVAIAIIVDARIEPALAPGSPGQMTEATLDRAVMWPVRLFVSRPEPGPRRLIRRR